MIELHGGTVEKFIGDEVMAVFGVPHVHEDDALRGVRAASDLLDRLTVLNEELERRRSASASRCGSASTPGEVVVGDPAAGRHVRHRRAGQPGEAARAGGRAGADPDRQGDVSARPGRGQAPAHSRPSRSRGRQRAGLDTARRPRRRAGCRASLAGPRRRLVGRREELDALRAAHDAVVGDRSCRLVTLLGAAGIGKSRLAEELAADVAPGTRVLASRCLPYGDGITFWPLSRDRAADSGQDELAAALRRRRRRRARRRAPPSA